MAGDAIKYTRGLGRANARLILAEREWEGIWQVLVCVERHRFNSDATWAGKGLKETLAALRSADPVGL